MEPSAQPQLSVITVTFRDPEGLRRTLQSLLALQGSGVRTESIIIDSSPEENAVVLEELGPALNDAGFNLRHILQVPAKGIYAAMNLAVQQSRGEYLWFLHSRDTLLKPALLKPALDRAEKYETDQLWFGAAYERGGKRLYVRYPESTWEANVVGHNRLCQPAIIYHRRVFERIGNFSLAYPIAADYLHHLRAFLDRQKGFLIKDALISFDMDGASSRPIQSLLETWSISFATADALRGMRMKHFVKLGAETARIAVLKSLLLVPGAPRLRPLFHRWNDHRSAARRAE